MIHFKFVAIKDMHNIYYLGLSGERSLPFGLLVINGKSPSPVYFWALNFYLLTDIHDVCLTFYDF